MMFLKMAAVAAVMSAAPAGVNPPVAKTPYVTPPELILTQSGAARSGAEQQVLPRAELRELLRQQRERAVELQAALGEMRKERDRLAEEVARRRAQRPDERAEMRQMREEIAALRKALVAQEAVADRRVEQIDDLHERLANRGAQVADLRHRNEELRSQLAAVREAVRRN